MRDTIHFHCPHCGAVAMLDTGQPPLVLDSSRRDDVLRLIPFFVPCGICGKPVAPPCPALYQSDRFAVRLSPPGFALASSPNGTAVLRDSSDLVTFREKILVLEAGYDDRAVEILKIMTEQANGWQISSLVAMDASPEEIVFTAQDKGGAELLFRSPRPLYDKVASQLGDPGPDDGFRWIGREWAMAMLAGNQVK